MAFTGKNTRNEQNALQKTQQKALTPGCLDQFKEVSEHTCMLGDRDTNTLYKTVPHLGIHCMHLKESCIIHEFIHGHLLKSYTDVVVERIRTNKEERLHVYVS